MEIPNVTIYSQLDSQIADKFPTPVNIQRYAIHTVEESPSIFRAIEKLVQSERCLNALAMLLCHYFSI